MMTTTALIDDAFNHATILLQDLLKDPIMLIEIKLLFAAIVYSFVWSIISHNYSKVDQIWSIIPIAYVLYIYNYTIILQRLITYPRTILTFL